MERLIHIEAQIRATQDSVYRMRRWMFYRFVVIALAILLPVVTLPFFLDTFLSSYFDGLTSMFR